MEENTMYTEQQLNEIVTHISDTCRLPVIGGIGGVPIGTEMYIEGTTPPTGWLICDGSTKNIQSYPELATYFASKLGSTTVYGGNGSTTFGLPTRKGMPYNVGDVYDTTERIVGVWTDNKPVYQKTIDCGALPNATSKEITTGIASSFLIIDIDVVYQNTSTYGSKLNFVWQTENTNFYIDSTTMYKKLVLRTLTDCTSYTAKAIIRYTKTTDSAVPAGYSADRKGMFCIKAQDDES